MGRLPLSRQRFLRIFSKVQRSDVQGLHVGLYREPRQEVKDGPQADRNGQGLGGAKAEGGGG